MIPRVSVLMPVYNTHPEYLREAIESILAQTYTDFEFIILNDCSTDPQVEATIRAYTDPRIVYAVNECNLGISGSRNRLLDMAQGEYLAVMDHDDISLPTRLEKEVDFLDTHPDAGIVGTLVENMADGKIRPRPSDDIDIKKMLMLHCNLSHPSCMLRSSVLKKHNIRYEKLYSPAEDYALFARLIAVTQFAILQEPLFRYRAWEGNTSHKRAKAMEAAAEGIHVFMRRENPEIWAMAQSHLKNIKRYKLFGIPFFSVEQSRKETKFLLFCIIPIFTIRRHLPVIIGM